MTAAPSRRRRGTGSIDPLPDGRWRPRLPASVGRVRLDPCGSYKEAADVLDAALAEIAERSRVPVQGETLRAWGTRWLDDREIGGIEDADSDRSRWRVHIETATFIDWHLGAIRPVHVRDWLAGMLRKQAAPGRGHKTAPKRKLGKTTVKNTLNLLRCCLEAAVERELLAENPAAEVHLPRQAAKAKATHEPWTYLLPEEQARLLATPAPAGDPDLVDLVAFAMWTGVREGEAWNLELVDVIIDDAPHIVVRYGKRGGATKGGRLRRVPLFGEGLAAVERQLDRLFTGRPNPFGLLWPTLRGERRRDGQAPRHWTELLRASGIVPERRHDRRPVRWHDLRHTCGSSLVAGWRGRRWTLQEVRDLLGHRSITTTERYAHLAESALLVAARETHHAGRSAHDLPSLAEPPPRKTAESLGAPETTRTSDQRFRKTKVSESLRDVSTLIGQNLGRTAQAYAQPSTGADRALVLAAGVDVDAARHDLATVEVRVLSHGWDALEALVLRVGDEAGEGGAP